MLRTRRHFAHRDLRGGASSDDGRDILRARPPSTFLHSAMDNGNQASPFIAIQDANALRSVEAVRGKADQRCTELLHIDGNPTGTGFAIHIERDARRGADSPDLTHRLDGSDIVVHMMNRDQHGLGGQRGTNRLGIHRARRVDGHPGAGPSLFLQKLDGIHHAGVLRGRNHEMLSLALIRVRHALDRQIGGLGAIGREEDLFLTVRIHQRGHLLAGLSKRLAHPESMLVQGRRIAVGLHEIRLHCIEHLGQNRCARLVI